MAFEKGPYVKMAAFCEKALEEKDGVLTLVRIVDRLIHTAVGPAAAVEMPPVPFNLTIVIMLVPGAARGRSELKIEPESPSGLKKEPIQMSVSMEADDKPVNVKANVHFTLEQEGLYWFNVYLDEQLITW